MQTGVADNVAAMARTLRSRVTTSTGWMAAGLLSTAVNLGWGADHPRLRLLGGLLVAVCLGFQGVRLARSIRARSANRFWIRLAPTVVLILAVGAWYLANSPDGLGGTVAAVAVLVTAAWLVRDVPAGDGGAVHAANLPGVAAEPALPPERPYGWGAIGLYATLVLGWLVGLLQLPAALLGGVFLVGAVATVTLELPWLRYGRVPRAVSQALAALAPVYAMPYNGVAAFHIGMWSPYLARTGRPVVVVTTNPATFARLAKAYPIPILYAPGSSPRAVKAVLPRSLRAAFYVHNGANAPFVRHRWLTHVFLHHGDGDKPASSNPISDRYDILVVAGQAAIDRYAARGVAIAPAKFALLGRPQTEEIETVQRPISAVAAPVVLYAPTWWGGSPDQDFSSLLVGPQIVQALLDHGATVIFRPHPAGRGHPPHRDALARIRALLAVDAERTGRSHVFDARADRWSVAEVANRSDAMVADVSGVVTDYMQSLKPFAMVATRTDTAGFRADYPSSQSAYVLESGDLTTLEPALDSMLGDDPLFSVRVERRRYYLGGFEGGESAAAFVGFVDQLAQSPDHRSPDHRSPDHRSPDHSSAARRGSSRAGG